MSRYSVYIAGVDRTGYVRVGAPVGPGIALDGSIGARSTASFTTLDRSGVWSPVVGQSVDVYDDETSPSVLRFTGVVDRVTSRHIQGAGALESSVSCADNSAVVESRVVVRFFRLLDYGMLDRIATALVEDYLGALGYTYDSTNSINAEVGEITFAGVSLKSALDTLAQITGSSWIITADKKLRYFRVEEGASSPPTAISDDLENYVSATVTTTTSTFANRVYATSGRTLTQDWTDTFTGNGVQTMFITVYNLAEAPTVRVNGVAQTLIESARLAESPQPAYDFYWILGGAGVFQNPTASPLTSADTLTVTYPSSLPYIALAESPYSQSIFGVFETLISNADATDRETLDAIAAAELERLCAFDADAEIVTREDGFAAGQTVYVDIATPPILGFYLIENMTAREIGQSGFEYTLRLTKRSRDRVSPRANPAEYFGRLINEPAAGGSAREVITFILAGTIEGLTNPGLTAGAKQAHKVVKVGGVVSEVSLRWKTAPAATVEIDVLRNGTSIFSAAGITTASGSTAVSRVSSGFTSNPLRIEVGDVITIAVTTASSAAKDGTLDIVLA